MKRKISGSRSKEGFRYPVLRLSREFEWLIGREVEVEFRAVDGRRAIVIYVDEEKDRAVVQGVVQPNDNSGEIEGRIRALEERLRLLEAVLMGRAEGRSCETEWWARGDSNPGPPPCQGGVITSLDHGPSPNVGGPAGI